MLVVLAAAAAVIMVGVVVVAVGRGGEMAYFPSDYAPLDLGVVAATDVVLLRPPTSIWGYNIQVTDEALNRITQALSQRDVRIASLEQQVAELRAERDTRPIAPDPTSAGTRAARWEARGAGWDAATSDRRTGEAGSPGADTAPAEVAPPAEHQGRETPNGAAGTVARACPADDGARTGSGTGEDTAGSGD